MRRIGLGVLIGCAALATMSSSAYADAACRQTAKDAYVACRAQCKNDFVDAKFACRDVQPGCGEACLAGRQQCFDNVDLILQTGTVRHCSATIADACQIDADCPSGETCATDGTLANCLGRTDACEADFLNTAQTTCGATCTQGAHPACACHGDQACLGCIDQAQIARFLCRDGCGDSFRGNGTVQTLKATCRSIFKSCVQACPPAN